MKPCKVLRTEFLAKQLEEEIEINSCLNEPKKGFVGDYLMKDPVDGSTWLCRKHIFEKKYSFLGENNEAKSN